MYATVKTELNELLAKKAQVQQQWEAVRREGKEDVRIPSVDEIVALVLDVEARIKDDPTSAREALRQMVHDGRIDMEPQADGSYRARSVIFPLDLQNKAQKPRGGSVPSGASGVSHEVVGNDGCAGRI